MPAGLPFRSFPSPPARALSAWCVCVCVCVSARAEPLRACAHRAHRMSETPRESREHSLLHARVCVAPMVQFQENSTIRRLEIDRIEWLLR